MKKNGVRNINLKLFFIAVLLFIACNNDISNKNFDKKFYKSWKNVTQKNIKNNYSGENYYNLYKKFVSIKSDSLRQKSMNALIEQKNILKTKIDYIDIFEICSENSGYYKFHIRINNNDSVFIVKRHLYDDYLKITSEKKPFSNLLHENFCRQKKYSYNSNINHLSRLLIYTKLCVYSDTIKIKKICIDFD